MFDKSKNEVLHRPVTQTVNTSMIQNISPFKTEDNDVETDLLEILMQLTPASIALFNELKYTYNSKTNIVSYPKIEDTKSPKYKLYNRYLVPLKKCGLIKTINKPTQRLLQLESDRYYYLINPAIICCNHQQQAKTLWKLL